MIKKSLLLLLSLYFVYGFVQGQTTLELQVSASSDDAEQLGAGEINPGLNEGDLDLGSSDLELVDDPFNGTGQTVGIRFPNLDIPKDALILNAVMEFTVDDDNSGTTTVFFKVEDVANSATFSNTPFNISSRPTFNDSVSWNIPVWTNADIGTVKQAPAVTGLVQSLVNREDWSAGNAISFIVTGSGEREVTTFDANPSAAPKLIVTYIPVSSVESQVSASTDDAEELGTGEINPSLNTGDVDLGSSDLELVDDPFNGTGQTVGVRFTGIDIPQNAEILEAYIEFAIDDDNAGVTIVDFRAEDTDNSTSFANTPNNISSRPVTAGSVQWNIPVWTTPEIGEIRQTPDLSDLVQSVVNRSGWSAGNALSFVITGSGEREVTTFDANPALAPKLIVKYIPKATLTIGVNASTDDAEELGTGEINPSLNTGDVDLGSSDLELVDDPFNGTGQTVGVRFNNVDLPQAAIITNAYIEFTADDDNNGPTVVSFRSEDTDNATTFANTPNNISSRPVSTDSVEWNIPVFGNADIGTVFQTPDLTDLVSHVVNRPGWSIGNSIAFIITGSGEREVTTFDANPAAAPRLVVEYLQGSITFVPEIVKPIPNQELVAGWDLSIDFTPFFKDNDSELSFSAKVSGTDTLPSGLSLSGSTLSGIHNQVESYTIMVTASSDGDSISQEFELNYLATSGGFTLAIFHNNDGESDLLPDSITVNGQRVTGGSISQFKTTLDSLRAQATNRGYESMMLSSGDNFLAGLEYNASQANSIFYDASAIDILDYDAICLGNHDFDFGTQVLADFINQFQDNLAPYLSANLNFSNVPELQTLVNNGRIASSTVVTKGSEQIGVIGLTTTNLAQISSPGNTIISAAIADSVQKEVDDLTLLGVDKIILISHLQGYADDIALAGQVEGVDIIIAGGGDELLTNNPNAGDPYNIPVTDKYPVVAPDINGDSVYIVTTPGNYRYLGNLLVDFDSAGNVTRVYTSESGPVLVTGPSDSVLVDSIEKPIIDYIGDLSTNVIAIAEDTLDYRREFLRREETNGGNLFADAVLWQAQKDFASFGVKKPQIALQNSGGLRIESLVFPGPFTEDLTYEIAAFTNIISVVEDITPQKLLELVEHGVDRAPTLDGRFPQIAGFKVVYFEDEPVGAPGVKTIRLDDGTWIVRNGKIVAGAPDVTLATIDFTANGGDGYPFAPFGFTTLGATYQQAFRNYLVDSTGLNGVIPAADYPFNAEKQRIQVAPFPNCPTPANPTVEIVSTNFARLRWDNVPEAIRYRIEGGTSDDPFSFVSLQSPLTYYNAKTLVPGTKYFWRVAAVCDSLRSEPTVIDSFVMPANNVCPTPQNTSVTNITTNSATINWDAVPQATNYVVRGSANFLDLNNLVFFQTTSTVLNVSGLQPGTSYFWQIQSICTGNPQPNSLFTAVDTFTTVLNAPKTSTEGFVIRIYPNPANNYVKVEKGANDVFEVYDAMGRKIISTTDFVVDVTILQKGVYYWRVIGDSSQSGGALEIMR